MKPTVIDPKTTTRAAAFDLWMNAPNPMVTFFKTLDVTPLVGFSRKRRLKFNMLLCWCIGKAASEINVPFQKWLKANAGKTYGDAIRAYYQILEEKKQTKTEIGGQFEYNTYIRDFFADNPGKNLHDAIVCWNYKKGLSGHHRYEQSDLRALD